MFAVKLFSRGLIASAIGLALFCGEADSYTLTTGPGGQTIRWRPGQKFFLSGNPAGKENFPQDKFYQSVVYALQQWKWASDGQIDFDYWQGTNSSKFPTGLTQTGQNSIFFASNSHEKTDPNVIGFTQVWYNNGTGEMIESNTMLNDKDYNLTSDPQDTSSSSIHYYGSQPKVFIGNIITHELGHAIGLSHTGSLNSSMLYVEFSEQDRIGCDDWAGVRHLYPSPHPVGTGRLTGTILSPNGAPISGAQVGVISKLRGIPIATTLTDGNGHYDFGSIEAGEHAIYVEPYRGSANSIPVRYHAKAISVCGGQSNFPTNFYTLGNDHALRIFHVKSGTHTDAGVHHLQCNTVPDSGFGFQNTISPEMVVDLAPMGATKTYTFQAHGQFTLTGLGYLVMSSITPALSVTDAQGLPIPLTAQGPLYQSPDSRFKIPDVQLQGSAHGLIHVQVNTDHVGIENFPAPAIYPGNTPFYVLTFQSTATGMPPSQLPLNGRCAMPSREGFTAYHSPAGNPVKQSVNGRDGAGFCGSANANPFNTRNERRTNPLPLGTILGWFLPFFVAIGCHLFLRLRIRRSTLGS